MLKNNNYLDLAGRVLGVMQGGEGQARFTMDEWEWPTGVALYGVWKVYKKTGDGKYLDFLRQWYDGQLEKPKPHRDVNTVAPALALACLYEETKNPRYFEAILDWSGWVMNSMERTEYGGLQHMTAWNKHWQQLWDDTLFMAVLPLLKAGLLLGKPEWVEEAKYQFLFHIKYLQDRRTGLWRHGWTFDCRHNFAGAFWARGNSWFSIAAVEFLEMLGGEGGAAARFVLACLQDQMRALKKYQGECGLYNTLVDTEECYYETSASAGFAYGMLKGARLGYLPEEFRDIGMKTAEAVIGKIDADGAVQGVSCGTGMGKTLQHYKDIPVAPTAFGQGMAFLMLTELI
jgi:unsaturated rhamnogalacturonyl hydrolase